MSLEMDKLMMELEKAETDKEIKEVHKKILDQRKAEKHDNSS